MKVAILGAPGTGKHKFAQALARELGWKQSVIGSYVQSLRDTTGQEYGMLGNHIDDLQVVFKRLEWERELRSMNTITVGTILDSAAHSFARVDYVQDSEVPYQQVKLQAIAATFGMLYTDTWDYDYAFLLEGVPDEASRYGKLIAYGLSSLVATYHAPVITFEPEVPDDEKPKLATEAIHALEEDQPPSSAERGVRRGSEDGETDGDSSESVPDVPEQGTDKPRG